MSSIVVIERAVEIFDPSGDSSDSDYVASRENVSILAKDYKSLEEHCISTRKELQSTKDHIASLLQCQEVQETDLKESEAELKVSREGRKQHKELRRQSRRGNFVFLSFCLHIGSFAIDSFSETCYW